MKTLTITRPIFDGEIEAVSSKAEAHRALVAAALSGAVTRIECHHAGDDTLATAECLRNLGADVVYANNVLVVSSPIKAGFATFDCRDSGTTLRFLLPIAAAMGCNAYIDGSEQLRGRPLEPLLDCLSKHGAVFSDNKIPLSVEGHLRAGCYEIPGDISSQFISGLMFALPILGGKSTIKFTTPLKSAAFVDMTMYVLDLFGVHWKRTANGYVIEKGAHYSTPGHYNTGGDWSAAATFLAAAAIRGRVSVRGLSLSSKQPDKAILSILADAGAAISMVGDHLTVEAVTLSPFEAELSQCPYLFPTLAVLACGAVGDTRLSGASRLKLVDSDRLTATCEMLSVLGVCIDTDENDIIIHGTGSISGGVVNGHGDHRVVMAAALARSLSSGDITVIGAEAVSKSYPTFFDDFATLGGHADLH